MAVRADGADGRPRPPGRGLGLRGPHGRTGEAGSSSPPRPGRGTERPVLAGSTTPSTSRRRSRTSRRLSTCWNPAALDGTRCVPTWPSRLRAARSAPSLFAKAESTERGRVGARPGLCRPDDPGRPRTLRNPRLRARDALREPSSTTSPTWTPRRSEHARRSASRADRSRAGPAARPPRPDPRGPALRRLGHRPGRRYRRRRRGSGRRVPGDGHRVRQARGALACFHGTATARSATRRSAQRPSTLRRRRRASSGTRRGLRYKAAVESARLAEALGDRDEAYAGYRAASRLLAELAWREVPLSRRVRALAGYGWVVLRGRRGSRWRREPHRRQRSRRPRGGPAADLATGLRSLR